MQLKYKFYFGGEYDTNEKDEQKAYEQLTAERDAADPNKEKSDYEVFPTLDSWATYLIAHSKTVFWKMENDICHSEMEKADIIEKYWEEAKRNGEVGEWLLKSEADEPTKAMCFYMASLHESMSPNDITVDFRYYIKECLKAVNSHDGEGFSLEPYAE